MLARAIFVQNARKVMKITMRSIKNINHHNDVEWVWFIQKISLFQDSTERHQAEDLQWRRILNVMMKVQVQVVKLCVPLYGVKTIIIAGPITYYFFKKELNGECQKWNVKIIII